MYSEIYKGKKIVITGHTGFKGSWLATWLLKLGADVYGISKDIPTIPAMFNELSLIEKINDYKADIRDHNTINDLIHEIQPDFIFHLAAQAIVSTSYRDPIETISTNVIGTMNILESLRKYTKPCVSVIITSDKCYDNVEWVWGYKETDHLGGKDIYSGSKGAAELVIKSYFHSFFSKKNHPVKIVVGRAGNVIGGGDWAQDRLIADCMRSWSVGVPVEIRSPQATRPWQHVLEPLSGYLTLGAAATTSDKLNGEAFNFGPRGEQNHTVVNVLEDLATYWGFKNFDEAFRVTGNIPFHEAGLLKLNCDKALFSLKWESNLFYDETIELIGDWYNTFYQKKESMYDKTVEQISIYENLASQRKRVWTLS